RPVKRSVPDRAASFCIDCEAHSAPPHKGKVNVGPASGSESSRRAARHADLRARPLLRPLRTVPSCLPDVHGHRLRSRFAARPQLALLPAHVMQRIGLYGLLQRLGVFKLLPGGFAKMVQMLPVGGAVWPGKLKTNNPKRDAGATGKAVAFFPGCIGSVMFS